jgi:GST-like protein
MAAAVDAAKGDSAMSLIFYQAPMSSATPVTWAFAELQVPHETVKVELGSADLKKPEFLQLNPNAKVPTLVVDGTPMFEALAIMMWLGERYGVDKGLWPAPNDPSRVQAFAWSAWAYVTYVAALGRLFMATSSHLGPEYHNEAQAAYARKELAGLQKILDERLAKQPYMLGETFSLVDLIVAATIGYGAMGGVSVDAHEHLKAWLGRCQSRPSFSAVWNAKA